MLLAGVGLVLGASGCTSPAIDGSGNGTGGERTSGNGGGRSGTGGSTGSATPLPGAAEAVALETRLASLAVGVLTKTGSTAPSSRQKLILGQIRDAHLDHARALGSSDPLEPGSSAAVPTSQPTPPPATVAPELEDAIAALIAIEKSAVSTYQANAGAATETATLLWASLTAASHGYADVLGSDSGRSRTPLGQTRKPLAQLTELDALSQLLGQIDACLYGYPAALAKLSGSATTTAARRISSYYRLRDQVTAQIVAGQATPPAAAAVYVLDPEPTGASSASRLAAALETRIQPYLGQWVRRATGADRTKALTTLLSSVSAALGWGGALDRWPGWPS